MPKFVTPSSSGNPSIQPAAVQCVRTSHNHKVILNVSVLEQVKQQSKGKYIGVMLRNFKTT